MSSLAIYYGTRDSSLEVSFGHTPFFRGRSTTGDGTLEDPHEETVIVWVKGAACEIHFPCCDLNTVIFSFFCCCCCCRRSYGSPGFGVIPLLRKEKRTRQRHFGRNLDLLLLYPSFQIDELNK